MDIVMRKFVCDRHDSDFVKTISNYFTQQYYSDVVFICKKNVQVKAHKIVLAPISEFISRIVSAIYYQDTVYISVPDVDHKKLQLLLNVIYKGFVQIHREDVETLKELAYFLKIPLKNAAFVVVDSNTRPNSQFENCKENVSSEAADDSENSNRPTENFPPTLTEYNDCEAYTVDGTYISDEPVVLPNETSAEVLPNSDTSVQEKENTPFTSLETNFNTPQKEALVFAESLDKNTLQSHDVNHSSVEPVKENSFCLSEQQKKIIASKSPTKEGLKNVSNLRKQSFKVKPTKRSSLRYVNIENPSLEPLKTDSVTPKENSLSESTPGENSNNLPVHKKRPCEASSKDFISKPLLQKQKRQCLAAAKESLTSDDDMKITKSETPKRELRKLLSCNAIGNVSESKKLVSKSDVANSRPKVNEVQKKILIMEFNKCDDPDSETVALLSKKLNLSPKFIENWFRIRRQRSTLQEKSRSVLNDKMVSESMSVDLKRRILKETYINNGYKIPDRATRQHLAEILRLRLSSVNAWFSVTSKLKRGFVTKKNFKPSLKKPSATVVSKIKRKNVFVRSPRILRSDVVTSQETRQHKAVPSPVDMSVAAQQSANLETPAADTYSIATKQSETLETSAADNSVQVTNSPVKKIVQPVTKFHQKKRRTKLYILLQEYYKNNFTSKEEQKEIARKLNLSYSSVYYWFYRMQKNDTGLVRKRSFKPQVNKTSSNSATGVSEIERKNVLETSPRVLLSDVVTCPLTYQREAVLSPVITSVAAQQPAILETLEADTSSTSTKESETLEISATDISVQGLVRKRNSKPCVNKASGHSATGVSGIKRKNVFVKSPRILLSDVVTSQKSHQLETGSSSVDISVAALQSGTLEIPATDTSSITPKESEPSKTSAIDTSIQVHSSVKDYVKPTIPKERRKTKLSTKQISDLCKEYKNDHFATEEKQKKIARKLNLSYKIVNQWFCRMQRKHTDFSFSEEQNSILENAFKTRGKIKREVVREMCLLLSVPREAVVQWIIQRGSKKTPGFASNECAESSTSTQSDKNKKKVKINIQKERRLTLEYSRNKSATKEEQKEIARRLNLPCDLVISWFSDRQKEEKDLSFTEEQLESLEYAYRNHRIIKREVVINLSKLLDISKEAVVQWFIERRLKKTPGFKGWPAEEEPSTSHTLKDKEEKREDSTMQEISITEEDSSLPPEGDKEKEAENISVRNILTTEDSSLPLEQGTSILPMSIKGGTLSSYPYSDTPMSSVSSSSGSFSILQQISIKNEFSADLESSEHKNNSPTGSTLSVDYVGLHTASRSYYKGEPIVMIYKNTNETIKNEINSNVENVRENFGESAPVLKTETLLEK